MEGSDVQRLKALKEENRQQKHLVTEINLDNQVLKNLLAVCLQGRMDKFAENAFLRLYSRTKLGSLMQDK